MIATVNEPVDWISNIVIVEKPNKKLRICLDPQDLNRALKTVKFPIPTLKEIIPKLKRKKWFTVVDLSDGFWQVGLDDHQSTKLCNFSTPFGTYKLLRLPFWLNVSPKVFQSLLNKYFYSVEDLIIYFDDILISADTKEEHDNILNQVVQIARENNIKLNKNKIQYGMNEVKFLGFLFNEEGMHDPQRVRVINELKDPSNKTELQSILGIVNYLRDFIPKMSEIISPLRELLKKDKIWDWNESHSAVLNKVKHLICNASSLTNFYPNIKVEIQCDASQVAIGCCLLQTKNQFVFFQDP